VGEVVAAVDGADGVAAVVGCIALALLSSFAEEEEAVVLEAVVGGE
jgi:hypothetical protein